MIRSPNPQLSLNSPHATHTFWSKTSSPRLIQVPTEAQKDHGPDRCLYASSPSKTLQIEVKPLLKTYGRDFVLPSSAGVDSCRDQSKHTKSVEMAETRHDRVR